MHGYKLQVRLVVLVGSRSLRTVDVASMVDAVYVDDALVFVDPVDDAIRADSCAVPAFELPSERMPDSPRVGDQASEAELDNCANDPRRGFRETVELTNCRRRPPEAILIHATSGR